MQPQAVKPVKLIIGVLYTDLESYHLAREKLSVRFGNIDFESSVFDFTVSDYYHTEMGFPIYRIFISHRPLILPNEIARIKIETNALETECAVAGQRKVNLDPGYLDYDKFVLASAKYNGQKIYLEQGIYADLTLHYEKGQYYPFPWSFPDFKAGIYNRAFLLMRERYKMQMKKWASAIQS